MANPTQGGKNPQHDTGSTGGGMGDRARETAGQAREAASGVADRAREMASNVAGQAREMASNVTEKARQAASSAGHRVQDAMGSVGSGMESLAGSLRESAPREGYLGSAASHVADSLESGGRYLREEGFSGMAGDLTDLVRRNPIPALLIGIGVGFLLARATTSRS